MIDALLQIGYLFRKPLNETFGDLAEEHAGFAHGVKERRVRVREQLLRQHAMDECPSDIRNIRAYMLTTLYNAPLTMDNYYSALVNHDMNSGRQFR